MNQNFSGDFRTLDKNKFLGAHPKKILNFFRQKYFFGTRTEYLEKSA